MHTNVYIDGFNLYFAIKKTPFKWLDLSALCIKLLPQRKIHRIRYFTAITKARQHDLDAPVRQATYFRALRTLSNLTIHDEGHFVDRVRMMPQYPLAYRRPDIPPHPVQVQRTEEKGSDVNLASHLLTDCFLNDFVDAVVISNDADLTTPIKIVTKQFGKLVTVINPHRRESLSRQLAGAATTYLREINMSVYATCQFTTTLSDANGTFSKPSSW